MTNLFTVEAAASIDASERRRGDAEAAAAAELPNIETEEWRYSKIGELAIGELAPITASPSGAASGAGPDIGDRAATVVLADGWVLDISIDPGWAAKGLQIEAVPGQAGAPSSGDESQRDEETKLDLLHRAFSPSAVAISTPTGLSVRAPIVIVNDHVTEGGAAFPHVVVTAGDGSDVTIVDYQTSSGGGAGLTVPIVELDAEQAARLRYQTVQDLGRERWQLGRLRTSAAAQATLDIGVAAFGARYARLRADSRLIGRGATGNLTAAYYTDRDQVHDFRVFQHHEARDTRSDLVFKGAQGDSSGSIYTGLIHIHPDGAGTNAFQTNRNIKLSPDAWAWSVPNLEIENNEVHCSHASTVSPVDEDQRFYLHSRGVPPGEADRLIVAGFFHEVISRLPAGATHDQVRDLVDEKLDRRYPS